MQRVATHTLSGEVALAALAARQDAFESDLKNLSSAVVGLGNRIDDAVSSINSKLDQRSQPQWQTYIMAATLIGGLFFAFISPIQHDIDRLTTNQGYLDQQHRGFEKEVQNKLDTRSQQFVTVREHDEFKSRIDQQSRHVDEEISKIEGLLLRLLDSKK